ncbi:hypothetical protein B0H63DRAFT_266590 [Podospora didyma]|uniref:Subtelomeric hrmA-associated cluster protein AFUB-079030/YDR124W-like helical bundle domain-containing protein n=1 Tax=Podospora didyma TaxID=330526 RepID=A0AAE0N9I6_9PEZI|nr:hypothetical protein B0H63DRAFT_266590 [Podospora didyma]
MVQSGQHPRHWPADRSVLDHSPDDSRFYETATIRPPPLTIDRALREHCQINVQSYFLAARLEDGSTRYFSGPRGLESAEIPDYFQMDTFLRYQRRTGSESFPEDTGFPHEEPYYRDTVGPEYYGRRSYHRRRTQGPDPYGDESRRTTRKRLRGNVRREPDDDEPAVIVTAKKGIKIGNAEEVCNFYDERFKSCQQTACKLIAKIFIKTIAPKKQSNNPYTSKDDKAPDWWPKAWGPTKDEKVRHKEPDHLWKKERVHLLIHILRMVTEPNHKQHKDIQKLGITVSKLEETTMDALSTWFADKDKPAQALKKTFLKEIFKVAKVEEQYKNDEIGWLSSSKKAHLKILIAIDAGTEVFVRVSDNAYQSDDETPLLKEEEIDLPVSSVRVSPPHAAGSHNTMSTMGNEHNPAAPNVQVASSFISEIPVRGPQYPSTMMPSELAPEQHTYVESGNMTVGGQAPLHASSTMQMQDILTGPHDSSRRPSLYSGQSDFSGPSGSGLYSTPWQQQQQHQQGTTAPGNASLYSSFPHQSAPQPPGTYVTQQSASATNQGQQYPFDGIPITPTMYRNGSVGQGPVVHGQQSYPTYLSQLSHDSGRAILNDNSNKGSNGTLKMPPLNRGLLQ